MKKLQIGNMLEINADMVDAFNHLRANLGLCGDKIETIMITSSVPREGKTFVSMRLWKQLADVGIPTLLIECDLQRPQLCRQYTIRDTKELDGMVQYLSGQAELEDVLYETDVSNGYILPVTASNEKPELLLTNKRFSQMLEICKKKFGCVLIDTPTINNLPDAMNVAAHCDGIVLVVRSAATSRKTVRKCIQALKCTRTPLLGIVLNCFDVNDKSRIYYYQHRNRV